MNKTFLIGRLTKDVESGKIQSGHTYCKFSIAVNRSYKRDNDQPADFLNIVAWDGLAENCIKYLSKGKQVCVVGSIQTGNYEKNGVKYYTFDIRADQVEFLSPASEGTAPASDGASLTEVDDDDCPF